MRFTADGPDIPGDLLDARDDGQVIFFCGSGVSLHQAGGPTFPQLAQRVITELGVPSESTAAQVLGIAQNLPAIAGVGSVIATDQIFGLLERDFPVHDVRRAVAKAWPTHDAFACGEASEALSLLCVADRKPCRHDHASVAGICI